MNFREESNSRPASTSPPSASRRLSRINSLSPQFSRILKIGKKKKIKNSADEDEEPHSSREASSKLHKHKSLPPNTKRQYNYTDPGFECSTPSPRAKNVSQHLSRKTKLKAYNAVESSLDEVASDSVSHECAICLEVMENSTTMLPCQHRFHTECLKNRWWGVRGNECPLCRAPVPEPLKKMSYQDAKKRYLFIQRRVATGATSWNTLSDAERAVINETIDVWKEAAEKGRNPGAQFDLGVVYSKGNGVDKDFGEAVVWYTMAAKQGHMSSQYNLGNMYRNGHGVEPNDDVALSWYQLAAGQGHEAASYNLKKMMKESQQPETPALNLQPCMFAFSTNLTWGRRLTNN